MKRNVLATLILTAISLVSVYAQQTSEVPVVSKEQEKISELRTKLLNDKEKLAKLYQEKANLVAESNRKSNEAISATDRNVQSARDLSINVDSRSKAKKAKKAAKEADAKAKSANKANADVERNEKQIKRLEKSIRRNEAKLQKFEAKIGVNQ